MMNRCTKILAGVLGLFVVYLVCANVVYPHWIEPMLTIDRTIDARQRVVNKLEARVKEVERAKEAYKTFLARIGALDSGEVETDIRARLNKLIEETGMQNSKVSAGRRRKDSKTNIERMTIDVTGVAPLDSAVKFLKEVAELPHLVRVARPKITPVRSRLDKESEWVTLSVPLEVMVLPQQRILGLVEVKDFEQPESFARHAGRDYGRIWERKPFIEQEPPKPLEVRVASRPITAQEEEEVILSGTVMGGVEPYHFEWSPQEGVEDAHKLAAKIKSPKQGQWKYTLTVRDSRGERVFAVLSVNVKPKPSTSGPAVVQTSSPPPDPRWANRGDLKVEMTHLTIDGDTRLRELAVSDQRNGETSFYTVGDEFDGGTLVYVNQYGGVMYLEEECYVYPLGEPFSGAMKASLATDFPELQAAAEQVKEANRKLKSIDPGATPDSGAGQPAGPTNPDKKDGASPRLEAEDGVTKEKEDDGQRASNRNQKTDGMQPTDTAKHGDDSLSQEVKKRSGRRGASKPRS